MIGLGIVLLVAIAAAIALPESPDARLGRVLPTEPDRNRASPASTRAWVTQAAAGVAGLGALLLVGGSMGVLLGLTIAIAGPRLMARLETRSDRQRREDGQRQAPLVADLLASTLTAGVPVDAAVRAVARAVGEPSATGLHRVVTALELGADAEQAWRNVSVELIPLADAAARSARTGAPLSLLLGRIADDLARDRRRAVEVAARSAGVRAVAPLAACFLPAFLLVGVVPVVASLAAGLF